MPMIPASGIESVVVFRLADQRWALPVESVDSVVSMVAVAPLAAAPHVTLGVINVHGAVVPVVDLRRRLGLDSREARISDHLLLARSRRRRLAMPVDEVLGVSEVSAKQIVPPDAILPGIGHVAGLVALPDGLLFVQDLDAFLSLDEEQSLDEALRRAASPAGDSHSAAAGADR